MASRGDFGDGEWRGTTGGGGGATYLMGGATNNGTATEVGEGEKGIGGEGSLVSLTFSSFKGRCILVMLVVTAMAGLTAGGDVNGCNWGRRDFVVVTRGLVGGVLVRGDREGSMEAAIPPRGRGLMGVSGRNWGMRGDSRPPVGLASVGGRRGRVSLGPRRWIPPFSGDLASRGTLGGLLRDRSAAGGLSPPGTLSSVDLSDEEDDNMGDTGGRSRWDKLAGTTGSEGTMLAGCRVSRGATCTSVGSWVAMVSSEALLRLLSSLVTLLWYTNMGRP